MQKFSHLAISDPSELRFGLAPKPLNTRYGLCIGGSTVYPELNFTLPAMLVNETTMGEVRTHYRQIIHYIAYGRHTRKAASEFNLANCFGWIGSKRRSKRSHPANLNSLRK